MNENKNIIPIFFAVDDGYIPCLAVALESLIENASKEYNYEIKILYVNISKDNQEKIEKFENDNFSIEFVDVSDKINIISEKLYTRDYFSQATYFRLFIPELYPQYDKAIYLDSDITVLGDISELYNVDMEDNLIVATPDGAMQENKVFQDYAEKVVGVSDYNEYFNAGIIVMNLKELREYKFQEKFLYLLGTIKFAVAQDQDYLNRLCKGRVKLISDVWDRMTLRGDTIDRKELKLIHYNMANKPWRTYDVLYQEYFWEYAKKTEFYDVLLKMRDSYTEEDKAKDAQVGANLVALAQKECDCVGDDRKHK